MTAEIDHGDEETVTDGGFPPGQGRVGNVDDPVPDAEYRDEPPEHAPPCDDCGKREAMRSVECPVAEELNLDLCTDCYEERGPGIEICHVRQDSDWEVNGGRASAQLDGLDKRHMNNTSFPAPGWIGNPYPAEEETVEERQRVLRAYKHDLLRKVSEETLFAENLGKLRGKRVACWCRTKDEQRRPENTCHLDVVNAALMGVYTDD